MDHSILRCPITRNSLRPIDKPVFTDFNIPDNIHGFDHLDSGLIDESNTWFYPVFNGIFVLLPTYAVCLKQDESTNNSMSFDKKRVFDYYNKVDYEVKNQLAVYVDSPKWIDYRRETRAYIRKSLTRAARFYAPKGKYLLDIASGPIGLPEYMSLSDGYEYRICIDISLNALLQAKSNMEKEGKKGIFICGDITQIPLAENVCDTVLSQHTLYHIPKNDQKKAVEELYRVARPGGKIVIIYVWFIHSWLMNISLNVVQIYRLLRHWAGKAYVRLFNSKPRLYFYAHSPRWFLRTFDFSKDMKFYCWRSTNKYFLRLYVNSWLFQEKFLEKLSRWEEKYSGFLGRHGEYPAIVIEKKG